MWDRYGNYLIGIQCIVEMCEFVDRAMNGNELLIAANVWIVDCIVGFMKCLWRVNGLFFGIG